MPYNKGDFTQQGVNGDVSALIRLNEKRVMKVVLSSDDESDNCDISGKVYDLLNGTSYDIGSGGGGGDWSTAIITLRATELPDYNPPTDLYTDIHVIYNDIYDYLYIDTYTEPIVIGVPLYHGGTMLSINAISHVVTSDISGNITYDGDLTLHITGDCTIGVGQGK